MGHAVDPTALGAALCANLSPTEPVPKRGTRLVQGLGTAPMDIQARAGLS
jgi:hypothetical protein